MKIFDIMLTIVMKLLGFLIFLGIMIFAFGACLSLRSEAAEYKMGPGDYYDAAGNIVSLDGTVIVRADGTIVEDAFKSDSAYTVIGNGAGTSSAIPQEIVSGTDAGTAAGSTAIRVINEVAAKAGTAVQNAAQGSGSSQGTNAAAQSGGTQSASGTSAAAAGSISNNNVTGSGADAVYSFEGRKYKKASLYGTQKLTGYSAEETGTAKTSSGRTAQAYHTVAAPSNIPLGTVIIVEGKSGPYASRYNGVYVVEDRGGYTLESQGIIDIYCASAAESLAVTAAGWNFADIYIAAACD